MGLRICPKCNGKVSTSRNVCIHCGYVFPSLKKCPDCGEAVPIDSDECPICGYPFTDLKKADPIVIDGEEGLLNSGEAKKDTTPIEVLPEPSLQEPEDPDKSDDDGTKGQKVDDVEGFRMMKLEEVANGATETPRVPENESPKSVVENTKPTDIAISTNLLVQEQDPVVPNNESFAQTPLELDVGEEDTIQTLADPDDNQPADISEVDKKPTFDFASHEKPVECPYCRSHGALEIGVGFYLCETCKGRFLDLEASGGPVAQALPSDQPRIVASDAPIPPNDVPISLTPKRAPEMANGDVVDAALPLETPSASVEKINKKRSRPSQRRIPRPGRRKWLITILSSVAALGVLFGILTGTVFVPKARYDQAMSLLNSDVQQAINLFESSSWNDAPQQASFARARRAFKFGDFESGIGHMLSGGGEAWVMFNSEGGTKFDSRSIRPYGKKGANYINEKPVREGYQFQKWLLVQYSFNEANREAILQLKAKWIAN